MIKYANVFLRTHSWFVALFQAMLVLVSLFLAWLLRFDYHLPDRRLLVIAAPLLVLIRLITMWKFGLLHGWWKYTGPSDVLDVMKSVITGSVVFIGCINILSGTSAFPRSVYVLEPLLTGALLLGVRVFSRLYTESIRKDAVSAKQVMLIGAGLTAQTVIRELKRKGSGYTVLGCVDDDPSKAGIKVHGVPVLGTVEDLNTLASKLSPDEVLIAVPSASGPQMQRFVRECEKAGLRFRTVPALRDVIDGNVAVSVFRDVRVEDLLGREPVEMNLDAVRKQIAGKVIMVTGAAGSIGSEICRQVLDYGPAALLCVDQNETGIFYLERELSLQKRQCEQLYIVADIGDRDKMGKLFVEHSPEVVFHAAAYKHVPVMESNVGAAVTNNVLSLLELLDVAEESGCRKFILISSDKAVNPTNTMGATKRLGELIIAARPSGPMCSVAVRFGNVLGSSGSVIPVLQEQLRNGKALTITHPDMRRFFMTIREAVSLVLQAFVIGEQGDILVLDMGKPVKVVELAQTLIRLSGKREDQVDIVFSGVRQGEKLEEELFYPYENVRPTSCARINKAFNAPQKWSVLASQLDELRGVLYLNGQNTIRAKIREIVPEYSYDGSLAMDTYAEKRSAMGA